MSNKPFHYQRPSPLKKGDAEYYLLTNDYVSVVEFEGREIIKVVPQALILLARQAFHDASFMLRPVHQQQVTNIPRDPEASEGDEYVALQFLRNSDIVTEGILLICQDTRTVIIVGRKGQRVWTGGGDEEVPARGVYNTYIEGDLRCSQNAALDMYKEVNTGTNLPAQIDLHIVDDDEYEFLCITKGGDSADKTYLYQETKVLLMPGKSENYLIEKMRTLGIATCPPYHIAFVVDGASAEATLRTVGLASAEYYDELPTEGNEHGQASCDVELEKELLIEAQNLGLGVQFGGKYFAHDIYVIRLPRHGALYPVNMGVSCSADRNIKVRINREGIWIEELEHNPGKLIPEELHQAGEGEAVHVDLNHLMKEILAQLPQYPVSTRLSFNDTVIVGRDITYAKLKECLDNSESLPQYVRGHPIYYTGLAKTPKGYVLGSLGSTAAGCMDSYVNQPRAAGGSMIMLAKGNRSQQVTDACHRRGGLYSGSIGGPVVVLVQGDIKSLEYVEYPELGMEAVRRIGMENFPVFILADDRGNDLFK